jgi:hypothetical protein
LGESLSLAFRDTHYDDRIFIRSANQFWRGEMWICGWEVHPEFASKDRAAKNEGLDFASGKRRFVGLTFP